ncbi:MAG: hypothetical protein ABFS12_10970 [Bacteroidota bacterium]
MKLGNGSLHAIYIIVAILLANCSGGTNETPSSESIIQDSTSSQELELPQKRIVYQVPEMDDVISHEGVIYHSVNGIDLRADIYLPPTKEGNVNFPLVILVNDYPDSIINHYWGCDQKDLELFISWGELIAASGIAAVAYQTQFSHSETDSLIHFLGENAEKYRVDMNRLCVFGASANTLAAQSLMENNDLKIKCAILNYGILLTPDLKYFAAIDSAANMYGFYLKDLRPITSIPSNIPLMVTKAGKDQFDIVTKTTDHFVSEAIKSNAELTYIHYPEGQHDFDILDNTKTSKLIIRQTIDFLTTHLLEE